MHHYSPTRVVGQFGSWVHHERDECGRQNLPIFRQIEADTGQQLLVLEIDGEVMGTVVLLFVPNLSHSGSPWAEVENVVVDELLRGQGYGRLLMEYAEHIATEAGCYKFNC